MASSMEFLSMRARTFTKTNTGYFSGSVHAPGPGYLVTSCFTTMLRTSMGFGVPHGRISGSMSVAAVVMDGHSAVLGRLLNLLSMSC